MDTSLSVAAVRDRSIEEVADAVAAYAEEHRVECESVEIKAPPEPEPEPQPSRWPMLSRILEALKSKEEKKPEAYGQGKSDVVIFAPENGWTVLLWPKLFGGRDVPAARWLSRRLDTLVSDIHLHTGDFWVHYLFEKGKEVDRFASRPDAGAPNEQAAANLKRKWRGNPEVVAERFGVAPEEVQRYYVQLDPDTPWAKHEGDEFSILDIWVFTDFWRALGVRYPEDVLRFDCQLCLGPDFDEKLPTAGIEDL